MVEKVIAPMKPKRQHYGVGGDRNENNDNIPYLI